MTTAQLEAAAKALYKAHMVYEGIDHSSEKWKNLNRADKEDYRNVVREIYRKAMAA